jgi:hypothetical protein
MIVGVYSGKPSEDGGVKQDTTALQWSRNEVLSGPQFFLSTLSILDDMAKV